MYDRRAVKTALGSNTSLVNNFGCNNHKCRHCTQQHIYLVIYILTCFSKSIGDTNRLISVLSEQTAGTHTQHQFQNLNLFRPLYIS